MESNLSFFSLPFLDNADVDFSKIKEQGCDYEDLHPTLPSHGSLLGADDVLAQFLSGDEPLEEPDLNGPTTLHCEICRKQFDNAKKYYGHLRVHSKDNLWICDKCPNEKFSTKQQLMKHSLTHKPLKRVWRCPQCDMSFEALWRLQQHLFAKHLDYRPHKCDRCEMSFHKLSDLKKHKDIHDDIRKHACQICKMRFSDASNLKRHTLRHSNEKPYPCPGCGNRFTQLASMKRHSKGCAMVKPGNEPVDKTTRKNHCRVCGMTFQYKSALLEHCVRQHSNNPPPPTQNETPKEDKSNELHVDTPCSLIIDTQHSLELDTNRSVNTDINHSHKLETSCPVNIDINRQINIDTSRSLLDTSRSLNIDTSRPLNVDTNRTVDNIVDDILSAEDDYLIRNTMSNQLLNYNPPETYNTDNLMQIELLKEMNQMHILDDELLYNDLDFDSFQTMCNTNDMDYTDRNELLFDIADGRSMDQDIMNALYQAKGETLTDELLNPPEILNTDESNEKISDFLVNPTVSVNECATIFESDVDLEASTNLAANLNQLIGENSVQYISTEHDDTFIISLNSEIDAEQLTDMLNIGVGPLDEVNKTVGNETNNDSVEPVVQPTVVKVDSLAEKDTSEPLNQPTQPILLNKEPAKDKETQRPNVGTFKITKRKRVVYFCRKCNKIFDRKDNYKNHRAVHDSSLKRHKCGICQQYFSYRSTLNKHVKKQHTPIVMDAHKCTQCDKSYQASWMLKRHMARDHEYELLPFECKEKDCGKKFYKQSDLDVHKRFHTDNRPHKCNICNRGFYLLSHLNRHVQKVDCTKHVYKLELDPKSSCHETVVLKFS